MAMLTEHQIVPIAGPTGALLDNVPTEIVARFGGAQSPACNENSLSSEQSDPDESRTCRYRLEPAAS